MGRILLFTLLSFVSFNLSAQTFITDENFESKISGRDKFSMEDQHSIVVVEFYADFNKDNAFKDWDKIKDVKYYRCNVADAPNAKKKYRVRRYLDSDKPNLRPPFTFPRLFIKVIRVNLSSLLSLSVKDSAI